MLILSLIVHVTKKAARENTLSVFSAKNRTLPAAVVSVSDIEWIEAADCYVCLHAACKRHLLRESIRALETKLDPKKFIRLHRSAIVNLDHVREIHRDGQAKGWVLLYTGARVRLNRNGWRKLIDLTSAPKNPVF